jgi:hypothetical protein
MGSRLGISAGLVAAAAYFLALFNSWVPLLVLAGYVLLFERDEFMRFSVIKAVGICFFFMFISVLIGFIPSGISLIREALAVFNTNFVNTFTQKTTEIISFSRTLLIVIERIILIVLAVKALSNETVGFGPIDNIISVHAKKAPPAPPSE